MIQITRQRKNNRTGEESVMKFKEFVSKQNKAETKKAMIDKEARINGFKTDVAELYHEIERWMASFIREGSVVVENKEIDLFEEQLGRYRIEAKRLRIGLCNYNFTPIGTILIGADGRVDVSCGHNECMIVRKNGSWYKVRKGASIQCIKLDEASFQAMLMNLAK